MLVGEFDFSAFRAADCQAKSPVKTVRQADARRYGDMIVFDFEAGAFLHHMVRNLVGSLVDVYKRQVRNGGGGIIKGLGAVCPGLSSRTQPF